MKQQLIEWLIDEVGPAIKKTGDAHGELLKFARSKNLSPALAEAMGQLFNVAKTLSFMDKSANRGGSFPLVDVPKLVEDYMKTEEAKTATADSPETISELETWLAPAKNDDTANFPGIFFEAEHGIKIANETVVNHTTGLGRRSLRDLEHLRLQSTQLEQRAFDIAEDNRTIFHKWAKLLRQNPDLKFSALASDALMACGDEAKPMLDCMAHYMGIKYGAVAGHKRLVDDRNGFVGDIERLMANLAQLTETNTKSASLAEQIKAAAAAAHKGLGKREKQERQESHSPKFETAGPEKGSQGGAGKPQGIKSMPSGSKGFPTGETPIEAPDPGPFPTPFASPFMNDPNKSPFKTVPDALMSPLRPLKNFFLDQAKGMLTERTNTEQQHVDRSMADTQSMAMLQNLLMTDDVLSEADPERVASLYQTIRTSSPELANDANVMRVALRSAIQHEGMDPFTVKGFADTENERNKVQDSARKQDEAKYKIKGPSPKGEKGDKDKKDKD